MLKGKGKLELYEQHKSARYIAEALRMSLRSHPKNSGSLSNSGKVFRFPIRHTLRKDFSSYMLIYFGIDS
jgi:hypothetical protein